MMGTRNVLVFAVGLFLVLSFAAASGSKHDDNHELMIGGLDIDYKCRPGNYTTTKDKELTQVALNLEYFEAEYFLWGAYGYGLDKIAPYLVDGGPPPIGAQKANLDAYYTDIYIQMGLQEVGHLRAIKRALGDPPRCAFPRTQLDISKKTWADTMDKAFLQTFGEKLNPPYDPYEDSLKYLISTYTIPYVGLTGYVGANPELKGYNAKKVKLAKATFLISLLMAIGAIFKDLTLFVGCCSLWLVCWVWSRVKTLSFAPKCTARRTRRSARTSTPWRISATPFPT